MSQAEEVLEKWGTPSRPTEELRCPTLCRFLLQQVERGIRLDVTNILLRFNPAPSVKDPSKLAIWPDEKAYNYGEGKRLSMKPGRAFRRMLPWLSDADIEKLVDHYVVNFALKDAQYVIKVGTTAEDFEHAYSGEQAPMSNLCTTSCRKSLANSCMRYKFDCFDVHPVTAYASGDFKIVWVEDAEGRIAARAVVGSNGFAAPIYACNEVACGAVAKFIEGELGGKLWNGYGSIWEGLRIVAIPDGDDRWIGPYFDTESFLRDEGEYLVVDPCGDIDAQLHRGHLELSGVGRCICCGERVDEYEAHFSPDGGLLYCGGCFAEEHFMCEYYQEWFPNSEATEVNVEDRYGVHTELWSSDAASDYATETVDGELWREEDCLFTEDGDAVRHKHIEDGVYNYCQYSGGLYRTEELIVVEGELVHPSQVDLDQYTLNQTTGEYEMKEQESYAA